MMGISTSNTLYKILKNYYIKQLLVAQQKLSTTEMLNGGSSGWEKWTIWLSPDIYSVFPLHFDTFF